jgi:hypothetical protein
VRPLRILTWVGLATLLVVVMPACRSKEVPLGQVQRTALSLRGLQKALSRCQPAESCAAELLQMGGITWLEGYVVDPEHDDVVIYGQRLADWPEQSTADFVVALRNAQLRYALKRDNTYTYSDPGCSIDPDPNIVAQLQALRDQEDYLQRWEDVCQSPQAVRVLGIPFDTSFAKIMVDADYFMKRIVNGTAGLGLSQFESLSEMRKRQDERDVCSGRKTKKAAFSLNRFWFSPGKTLLDVDDGHRTTKIDACEVTLKTEQEHLAETGIAGTGAADPLAQRFAHQFTDRYRDIAAQKPIYKQLEQLYRMVALAKLLKREASLPSLTYLLEGYQVPTVSVERSLLGIAHVTESTHRCSNEAGEKRGSIWTFSCSRSASLPRGKDNLGSLVRVTAPSCGGVSVAINADEPRRRDLSPIRRLVLAARPAPDALLWPFGSHS